MKTEVQLEGPRVIIRPMRREDVDAMMQWRPFADPLYQPFDFAHQGRRQQLQWYEWRSRDRRRLLFTIEDAQRTVVGSLTLREIQGRQTARLGITIGSDFVSQGYGTEALQIFLDYYFDEMGF
ncbi:MAG: GNAT family N-acetyltransferase, partial [Anaerolineae bacterium]